MNAADFRFAFRALGDCRQPRRLVDANVALAAYAACDSRCELGRESYLAAFRFSIDFRKHLESTGSTRGFCGPCWAKFVWIDIDNVDLTAALDAARRLSVCLSDRYGVNDSVQLWFFSGSNGFHAGIPTDLWQPAPGRDFHRIARVFAEALAARAGIEIDRGVYDRVRCFRAPNSRHPKTGLHKRPLSVRELMHLSADRIIELARDPRPFELPVSTEHSEALATLWRDSTDAVRAAARDAAEQAAAGCFDGRLNRATTDFIREGVPRGERHRRLYSAAANLAEFGAPLALAVALLIDAARDCGLKPSDARRAIENGWRSVHCDTVTL